MIAPCLIVHFIISAHQSIFFIFFIEILFQKAFFFVAEVTKAMWVGQKFNQ